jgi:hypothetical protein
MSYCSIRTIKKTRKIHCCEACGKKIDAGSSAYYWAGDCDGMFYACRYHVECRDAEVEFNEKNDCWGDEYTGFEEIRDKPEDVEWLIEAFPVVASRIGLLP